MKSYADLPFLGSRYYDASGNIGPYVWKTFREISDEVDQFASGLIAVGALPDVEHETGSLQKAFKFLGISSKNRYEYLVAIQSAYRQGLTLVPLYDTLGPSTVEFIVGQTNLTCIACEGKKVMDLLKHASNLPSLKVIVSFEKEITDEARSAAKEHNISLFTYDQIREQGRKNMIPEAVYDPEITINTICYTSGTTGTPKGAILTHGNFMGMAGALKDVFAANNLHWGPEDAHISYLPYAHVLERVVTELFVALGCRIGYYRGDTLKIVDDVKDLQPTIFISVPRLLNRVFEKVSDTLSKQTGLKKALIDRAFEAKKARFNATCDPTHPIYDRLVFSKTKEALGGKVKLIFSGSAPMSAPVIEFLRTVFCCPFLEGYGMTETTCAGGITYYLDPEAGHVGGLLPCNELKVRDIPEMGYTSRDTEDDLETPRGEVCFRGSAVFRGYFKAPEKYAEVVDAEGWFSTGDVCKILPTGAIKIIDRAKNIFKLSQGEYVAPEKVENIYIQAASVSQCFVFGYSTEAFLVGVCVPNFDEFGLGWAKTNGKGSLTKEQLCEDADFKAEVLKQCIAKGKENGILGFEQVKGIHCIVEPFTVENDLLTPSFKLKRHVAQERFKDAIDSMYSRLR